MGFLEQPGFLEEGHGFLEEVIGSAGRKIVFLYNNLISNQGMITASSEATTFEKKYLVDGQQLTCWRSETQAPLYETESLLVDFSAAQTINCLAIGNHNLYGEITSLTLKFGTTSDCIDGSISLTITDSDSMFLFANQSYRYFKLEIEGADAITYYQIGSLWLGTYVELEKNPQARIFNYDPDYEIHEKLTVGGQAQSYEIASKTRWQLQWGSNNGSANYTILSTLWDTVKRDKFFWLFLDSEDNTTLKFVKMKEFNFPQSYNDHYPGRMTIEAKNG